MALLLVSAWRVAASLETTTALDVTGGMGRYWSAQIKKLEAKKIELKLFNTMVCMYNMKQAESRKPKKCRIHSA